MTLSFFMKEKAGFAITLIALAIPQLAAAASFNGTGTGNIPDSPGGGPADYSGSPLVVSFNVSGLTTNIQSMSLSITMYHQWVGDLNVYLTSPGGTNFTIFRQVGPPGPQGYGSSADLNGTYVFTDAATNTLRQGADALNLNLSTGTDYTNVIPEGSYQPSATGPASEPATSFSATSGFFGLTPAQAAGIWTLTFYDGANGDTGAVSSATFYINEATSQPLRITGFTAGIGNIQMNLTGPANQSFNVWFTTNVALPFGSWDLFGSGSFDNGGNCTFNAGTSSTTGFFRVSTGP